MPKMKNAELRQAELKNELVEALKRNEEGAVADVLARMANEMQSNLVDEARSSVMGEINDRNILASRGAAQLTQEERAFYEEAISKRGFTDLDATLPTTVFDRVFEDLEQNHPLLKEIKFENTTATQEWIMRKTDCEAAWWGTLTDTIKKELEHGFEKTRTDLYKLSAYMPVSKSMLDLGPEWLDRYVRTVLYESIAIALELAIIAGTGKDQPIGMMKNLKGSVVEGVYSDKTPVVLPDFKPETLGAKIMAPLTKDGKRAVPQVLIIVNPVDYWEKIFPSTTVLTSNGNYVYGVLPIPGKIIQSVAIPKGKMIAGMAKDYFIGVGSTGKIETSEHYRFLEDETTYLCKQYATGKPKDNDAFILFDITNFTTVIARGTDVVTPMAARSVESPVVTELLEMVRILSAQNAEILKANSEILANISATEEPVEELKATKKTK